MADLEKVLKKVSNNPMDFHTIIAQRWIEEFGSSHDEPTYDQLLMISNSLEHNLRGYMGRLVRKIQKSS